MKEKVMCNDCIHQTVPSENGEWHFCDQFNAWTEDDDFCSMGEEKANESELLTESFFPDLEDQMDALFGIAKED